MQISKNTSHRHYFLSNVVFYPYHLSNRKQRRYDTYIVSFNQDYSKKILGPNTVLSNRKLLCSQHLN